jgi:hypothetical protein
MFNSYNTNSIDTNEVSLPEFATFHSQKAPRVGRHMLEAGDIRPPPAIICPSGREERQPLNKHCSYRSGRNALAAELLGTALDGNSLRSV